MFHNILFYSNRGILQAQQSEPNVMPSDLSPSTSGSNITPYRFVGRYEDDFPLRKTGICLKFNTICKCS